jgi:RNA polymerase sigma factor for flagellar operon FliA
MNPEETYLEHLRTIERIAAFVARRNHLQGDDAAEFIQEVRFRLLDDNYAVIRKFEGRSSFSTYLTTVITRLFQQWRVEQWGKWRPSAEAKRLGDKAIVLERLISRDGHSFHEAARILTTPGGADYTIPELEAIYLRLPLRNPRPVVVSDDALPESIASDGQADERVEMQDRERAARHAARLVDELLGEMNPDDRLILQMRFGHALKVPEIARRLQLDQKKLYKRLDQLFLSMRRKLEAAGVRRGEIAVLLLHGDDELRFHLLSEKELFDPSNESSGEKEHSEETRVR